jgi:hypothetical protein
MVSQIRLYRTKGDAHCHAVPVGLKRLGNPQRVGAAMLVLSNFGYPQPLFLIESPNTLLI